MLYKIGMFALLSNIIFCALIVFSGTVCAQPVTVVAFNVQYLFDTIDDSDNPGDDAYLPLALKDKRRPQHDIECEDYYKGYPLFIEQCKTLDWSEKAYATKLQRLGDVINAMTPLPDVIVMQETENKRVLDDLVSQHLANNRYSVIHLDTSDEPRNRGLDVGIITRLELAGQPKAYKVNESNNDPVCRVFRDIIAAPLRLPDGETLHMFGVHFLSSANRFLCRIREFKKLNDLSLALEPQSLSIAVGDFNFSCNELRSDMVAELLELGHWYASPVISHGCNTPGSHKILLNGAHLWSFLDLILVSDELTPDKPSTKNWFADLGSFGTLVVDDEQVLVDDMGRVRPRWFDPSSGRGVSDHWPVAIRLMTRRGDGSTQADQP